ncbi:alpha/beta hydrolase [Candidatus Micrarchaeota archaeon]|nr:alpha/beta hydrolase [Candidatus Micrarchaeota archaeon]
MAYVDHNGYELFYEIQGQGNSSIIFIHGLCGDHRVWSKTVSEFRNKYRVVVLDLFGHGNSSSKISPKAAFDAMPGVIEKLIEKENLQSVVLVGHSIVGNILSSCIEAKLNVRGYVFVDCTFNASERVVNSRNKLADSLLANPPDKLNSAIIAWYKTMMDMNSNAKDNELILSSFKKLNGNWALNFLKSTNIIRQVPKTSLPMLIFESTWLTKDEPERSFHKVLPQADFSLWQVTNHFFWVYDAPKFNKILKEFLDKIS